MLFALSWFTYRRRYARYHWLLLLLCLPALLTVAWALSWTTVITDAKESGNGGDMREIKLAADGSTLYIQLATHIGTTTPGNHAPTDISLSNTSVAENAAGAVIGNLSTVDPDAGDTHTYSVSDNRFDIFYNAPDATLILKAGQALDYETEPTVNLTITTTDSGGLTFSKDFTINVIDDPADNSSTGKLNDTGITWGGNYPNGSNSDCSGVEIAAQDCSHGRDARALAGALVKIGGGEAGFDFTKLDNSGNALPASAATWACVRDNVTGLVWEVKTDNGGLHDKDNSYTWYNTDSNTNGGNAGTQNGGTCPAGTGNCDTGGFVAAVNSAGLCGQSDWRLPTREELRTIANLSTTNPAIDAAYFPNTLSEFYWSSLPDANWSGVALGVSFDYGYDNENTKNDSYFVRLVRGL